MGENKEFERQYLKGELEVELTPQVMSKDEKYVKKHNGCFPRVPWLSGFGQAGQEFLRSSHPLDMEPWSTR